MACNIDKSKIKAIRDVTRAAVKASPEINTLDKLIDWFATNRPEISKQDVVDSFVATTPRKVDAAKKAINDRIKNIRSEAKLVSKISDLIDNIEKKSDPFPTDSEMEAINSSVQQLYRLIEVNKEISNIDRGDIFTRIADIQLQYGRFFDSNISDQHKTTMKESMRVVKEKLQISKLDAKLKDLDERKKKLEGGEIDVDAMFEASPHVESVPLSDAILEKENALFEKKQAYEAYKNTRRIKEIAKQKGLFGFKGSAAVSIREKLMLYGKEIFEAPRTMKFMADMSFFFTQLAPYSLSKIGTVDLKALRAGEFANTFASQRDLVRLFKEYTLDVLLSDVDAAKTNKNFKKATGEVYGQRMKPIIDHPLYSTFKKWGLALTEARSVSGSEEMFHSGLLERIPGLGFIKGISEDMMVATINAVRFEEFLRFYRANPGLPESQYIMWARFVNQATGAGDLIIGGKKYDSSILSYGLSAPRLLISRVGLAIVRPVKVIGSIDINQSIKDKGLRFQSPAEKYIAQEMFRIMRGYMAMAGIFIAANALLGDDEVDYELKDPEENDFLKISIANSKYDYTGGVGAIVRMLSKMYYNWAGLPEDASFLAKRSAKIAKAFGDDDPLDPAIQALIKNRVHPTVSFVKSVITGSDFFGRVYQPDPISASHTAFWRSMSPIFIETLIDQELFSPNSGVVEDKANSLVQLLGVNVLSADDKSQNLTSKNFFNKNEIKPDAEYPSALSKKTHVEDTRLKYLRQKYKLANGDMLGNIIESNPDMSKSEFSAKSKSGSAQLQREFVKEYSDQIKKLKKIK